MRVSYLSASCIISLICRIYNNHSLLENEKYLLLVCSKRITNTGKPLSAIHGNLQDQNLVGKAWRFYSAISFTVSNLQEST